jgi:hypothetical protein
MPTPRLIIWIISLALLVAPMMSSARLACGCGDESGGPDSRQAHSCCASAPRTSACCSEARPAAGSAQCCGLTPHTGACAAGNALEKGCFACMSHMVVGTALVSSPGGGSGSALVQPARTVALMDSPVSFAVSAAYAISEVGHPRCNAVPIPLHVCSLLI